MMIIKKREIMMTYLKVRENWRKKHRNFRRTLRNWIWRKCMWNNNKIEKRKDIGPARRRRFFFSSFSASQLHNRPHPYLSLPPFTISFLPSLLPACFRHFAWHRLPMSARDFSCLWCTQSLHTHDITSTRRERKKKETLTHTFTDDGVHHNMAAQQTQQL